MKLTPRICRSLIMMEILDYLSGEYTYNYSYYGGGGYSLGFHFQENIGSATNPNFANPISILLDLYLTVRLT